MIGGIMRRTGRGKKNQLHLAVAKDRIARLYGLSFSMARSGDLDLARRYTSLARKIGMRYTVRIPTDLKRMTCRNCMLPLLPGRTSRVRVRPGKVTVTCLECGHSRRIPHGRQKDE